MATGRSNKLVGQTGEYLVAAELSRRGLIATTFTGNVPHYDIIASDETGQHVSVQVKTSRAHSWQFSSLQQFCEVTFDEKRQVIGNMKPSPVLRLIVILVRIADDRNDLFYVLAWEDLRDLLVSHHKAFLAKNDWIRPKNWRSLHCAIAEKVIRPYQDRWDIINQNLR